MAIASSTAPFKGTTHALPSPSGAYIAFLTSSQLHIRSSRSLTLTHKFNLHPTLTLGSRPTARPVLLIRWSPTSERILVASAASVFVYSLPDQRWRAHVSNGSGGLGRIINAEFGSCDNEVLTWTDFSASLTVWDLQSGKSIEIRDPKFHTGPETRHTEEGPGWAYKPLPEYLNDEEGLEQERHGHNRIFALLSRVGPRDILTVHASRNYEVIGSTDLPSIDARGLKWSPDGRWLAVWEAPSQGMRIWVYTADGHLFRTYPATANAGVADAELGIRSLEWSPSSDWLAVGGFDRRVTLLNTRTFAPLLHLDHTPHIHLPISSPIYTEILPSSTNPSRSYTRAPQPFTLPTTLSFNSSNRNTPSNTSSDAGLPSGISYLAFNPTSTLLATLSPTHPSTIWTWDLQRLVPRAVIVQSQPVKRISWAPNRPGLLLIQCRASEPIAYLWDAEGLPTAAPPAVEDNADTEIVEEIEETIRRVEAPPQILHLPLDKRASGSGSRLEATWLPRRSDQAPAFVFGDTATFIVVRPRGSDSSAAAEQDETIVSPAKGLHSSNDLGKESGQVKSRLSDGRRSAGKRPGTPTGGDESEDSLYEILTGKSPMRVQQIHVEDEGDDGPTMRIADMVDAEEGEDDFTRMDDTFAGKKGISFSDDSEIF